jgi:hypothetical protein
MGGTLRGFKGARRLRPTKRMRDSDDSVSLGVHSYRFVVELNGARKK